PTYLRVSIECTTRQGVPIDTPVIVSVRTLRAGHGHVAYLHANNPGLPGYIPDATDQMNGTDPFPVNSIVKVEEGVWDARLPALGATGGTVQVSGKYGIGVRCGVVSW